MNQTMPVKKVGEDFSQSLMKTLSNPQNQEEHGPSTNNHHGHSIDEEMYGGK
jgi:hypothetical protein